MGLPKTIAVASQKGGVAKTTTCVSLGASLAEQGKRVLLMDLDPQAHLTLALGLEPDGLNHTVADAFLGGDSLEQIIRETDEPFLHLAPANQRMGALDKWLYGRPKYEHVIRNRLDTMGAEQYDVVIVDTPPSLGTLTLNALTAARLLIIPTPCEYYASRSLHRVLQLVQLVRDKTNPMLSYRILITMFDKRYRLSHMIREQMERRFAEGLLKTVIDLDGKLRESAAAGQPITLYAPYSRGAVEYRALAQELMSYAWE